MFGKAEEAGREGKVLLFQIIKKDGETVTAYRVGEKSPELEVLVRQGKIKNLKDGCLEIFSQEAVHGKGEIARPGDYIKIDAMGVPYPNSARYFEKNHRHIAKNQYEQIPQPLWAWSAEEPMCEEIEFLTAQKRLVLDEKNPERYYTAELWGTLESAAKDAILVFYSVDRNENGKITDVDFNFVAKDIFETTYKRV